MPKVADILRRHGQEYLRRFGDRVLPSHRRAIHDILSCRTEAMGGQVWKCPTCQTYEFRFHSCRNRACPGCQGEQTDKWFAAREKEMVNAPCFHLVFTIPEELRRIFRSNQRLMYSVLMKAAIEATQQLARDPHFLGGEIAVLAVDPNPCLPPSHPPPGTCLRIGCQRRLGSSEESILFTSEGIVENIPGQVEIDG